MTIGGCDHIFAEKEYEAIVVIEGIEFSDHYDVFTVTNDYNNEVISWESEEVENNKLKGKFTDFTGEMGLSLVIDDNHLE